MSRRSDPICPIRLLAPGSVRLVSNIWERFGDRVRRLVDETAPVPGPRTIDWDLTDDHEQPLGPGHFIVRVTVDGLSEMRISRMRAASD